MVQFEATFLHHFFQVTIRELIPAIPPDAQENKGRLEVSLLEGR
jgi:hypothetical protein